jgi:hypothetical protein
LRYTVGGEEEARQLVSKALRRRASARQRIGVSYRFRELVDPWEWVRRAEEIVVPHERIGLLAPAFSPDSKTIALGGSGCV